jgi:hypothetical protein
MARLCDIETLVPKEVDLPYMIVRSCRRGAEQNQQQQVSYG